MIVKLGETMSRKLRILSHRRNQASLVSNVEEKPSSLSGYKSTTTDLTNKHQDNENAWAPIKDVPLHAKEYKTDLIYLKKLWSEQSEKLKHTDSLKEFNERLVRSWSIETGIIERLYDIDRGITETLVTHGFEVALIPHDSKVENPTLVIEMLKDQQGALDMVFDYIRSDRPLSNYFIKELHSLFTKNQHTTDAINQNNEIIQVPLLKGQWKIQPNNPKRIDGTVHEYAPPIHVQAEMDRLIEMYDLHVRQDIAPETQAAWLHHAFTQIHPFQDGNGRIARAIASFVFIKYGYFPLVIMREDRDNYIDALESADNGNLIPLIELFSKAQRRAFLQALGVSQNVITDKASFTDILDNVLNKLEKRENQDSDTKIAQAISLSNKLEDSAFSLLSAHSIKIKDRLKDINQSFDSYTFRSNKKNRHWFYGHIIDSARTAEYFADVKTYSNFICLKIKESQTFTLVLGFHAIGKQKSGTFGVMPFFVISIDNIDQSINNLSDEPFIFSYAHAEEQTIEAFRSWLSQIFSNALIEWGNRIS